MSADVIPLKLVGGSAAREPVPEIVEALEELLAKAKAGDVQGFAYATEEIVEDKQPACANGWWFGNQANGFALLGSVTVLQHAMAEDFNEKFK